MTSSARRALRVLGVVNSAVEPMGVTAIADAMGILPGTVYRSLDALERCEFVERYRASTQYQVGEAAKRLKHTLYSQFSICNLAIPFMRRLAFATNDTVSLTAAVGWMALRLAVVGGSGAVRSVANIGVLGALDEDPSGLALLAGYDAALLRRFLDEAPARRDGERSPDALRVRLEEIARRGYAIGDSDEHARGSTVAVPVLHQGKPIAAICIEGPVHQPGTGLMPDDWPAWRAIIGEIESQVASTGNFKVDPFGHLDRQVVTRLIVEQPTGNDADEDEAD